MRLELPQAGRQAGWLAGRKGGKEGKEKKGAGGGTSEANQSRTHSSGSGGKYVKSLLPLFFAERALSSRNPKSVF